MGIVWTTHADQTLTALWAEGHTATEIGRRMGLTKNQVLGRAHRLGCPMRIKPPPFSNGAPRPAATGRPLPGQAPRPKAPPAPKPAPPQPQTPAEIALAAQIRASREAASQVVAPSPRPSILRPAPLPRIHRTCQWPTGDKRREGITFDCQAEPVSGRPYCADHCARAFVRHAPHHAAPPARTASNEAVISSANEVAA